jgi:hypothetical protein
VEAEDTIANREATLGLPAWAKSPTCLLRVKNV